VDVCFANAKCEARFVCSYSCATEAGVTDFSDPALQLAFPVLDCSQQLCPACSLGR
jgi:hypothetical protein